MSTINGVVIGLVTQVQPGQVKVNFPWLDDQHESDWIRIATAMSGSDRGTFLMPELHDEVLVAFDQGNPRMPYIVGFLWNGQDQPPGQDVRDRKSPRAMATPSAFSIRRPHREVSVRSLFRTPTAIPSRCRMARST